MAFRAVSSLEATTAFCFTTRFHTAVTCSMDLGLSSRVRARAPWPPGPRCYLPGRPGKSPPLWILSWACGNASSGPFHRGARSQLERRKPNPIFIDSHPSRALTACRSARDHAASGASPWSRARRRPRSWPAPRCRRGRGPGLEISHWDCNKRPVLK